MQALQVTDSPPATTATTPLDVDTALIALHSMHEQLRNADMAATDSMAALQRQFGSNLCAQLRPMEDAVGALDFDGALRFCKELINELKQGQPA
ncbi:MAG: hypothetical protein IPP88_18650 [Betaproteobacteria bacterium]|nr:hypothetical protein [Betaproteobacteria bacterium]